MSGDIKLFHELSSSCASKRRAVNSVCVGISALGMKVNSTAEDESKCRFVLCCSSPKLEDFAVVVADDHRTMCNTAVKSGAICCV